MGNQKDEGKSLIRKLPNKKYNKFVNNNYFAIPNKLRI